MIKRVEVYINELNLMKKYPKELFFVGNLELLKKPKISIIGTRRPSSYTQFKTAQISSGLSQRGVCIVSGAAMGVDAIAHKSTKSYHTIAVMANGLDIKYPKVNKEVIANIEKKGLIISQFKEGFHATPWSFVVRNEIVVSLGDALIVSEADLKSGSMRSVEYALRMKKKIYVLPHRLDESKGTNYLLKNNLAIAIYDIDEFISGYGNDVSTIEDEFIVYCKTNPTYEEAIKKYSNRVFEYELNGVIEVKNSKIVVI
ncbi:MAG: DNA-protecting protein DprA [Sulfurospirillum sp.]|nr:DNA-protecting protein DprA [Sulfurospirillum sp.]MBL0703669.1 DNA-protecting protein DprA [Sulfurospirillum sp.]